MTPTLSSKPLLSGPLALDRLGHPLDPPQPRVPGRADGRELRDGARELLLVDLVADLSARRRRVHQANSVQHRKVLVDNELAAIMKELWYAGLKYATSLRDQRPSIKRALTSRIRHGAGWGVPRWTAPATWP